MVLEVVKKSGKNYFNIMMDWPILGHYVTSNQSEIENFYVLVSIPVKIKEMYQAGTTL